jgi:hypothetical protein
MPAISTAAQNSDQQILQEVRQHRVIQQHATSGLHDQEASHMAAQQGQLPGLPCLLFSPGTYRNVGARGTFQQLQATAEAFNTKQDTGGGGRDAKPMGARTASAACADIENIPIQAGAEHGQLCASMKLERANDSMKDPHAPGAAQMADSTLGLQPPVSPAVLTLQQETAADEALKGPPWRKKRPRGQDEPITAIQGASLQPATRNDNFSPERDTAQSTEWHDAVQEKWKQPNAAALKPLMPRSLPQDTEMQVSSPISAADNSSPMFSPITQAEMGLPLSTIAGPVSGRVWGIPVSLPTAQQLPRPAAATAGLGANSQLTPQSCASNLLVTVRAPRTTYARGPRFGAALAPYPTVHPPAAQQPSRVPATVHLSVAAPAVATALHSAGSSEAAAATPAGQVQVCHALSAST